MKTEFCPVSLVLKHFPQNGLLYPGAGVGAGRAGFGLFYKLCYVVVWLENILNG